MPTQASVCKLSSRECRDSRTASSGRRYGKDFFEGMLTDSSWVVCQFGLSASRVCLEETVGYFACVSSRGYVLLTWRGCLSLLLLGGRDQRDFFIDFFRARRGVSSSLCFDCRACVWFVFRFLGFCWKLRTRTVRRHQVYISSCMDTSSNQVYGQHHVLMSQL